MKRDKVDYPDHKYQNLTSREQELYDYIILDNTRYNRVKNIVAKHTAQKHICGYEGVKHYVGYTHGTGGFIAHTCFLWNTYLDTSIKKVSSVVYNTLFEDIATTDEGGFLVLPQQSTTKEENNMKVTIVNQTLLNDKNVKDMSLGDFVNIVKTLKQDIEKLQVITEPSKAIAKAVAEKEAQLKQVLALMDEVHG